MAALFVAGCTRADEPEEQTRLPTVVRGEIAARYVTGDRLGTLRLAAPVSTTLIANLAPAAVPDRAGGRIAYNAWLDDRPVVRVRDGLDTVLAEGAYSPAWRRDGAIAYFKALQPALATLESIRRYRGHVVVRGRPDAAEIRWTLDPARYVVAGWAGERLLAYRIGSGWPELLVLDAPGRARVLARDAALVAIAPDARRVFVSTYGADPPVVRMLEVASGREVARRMIPAVRWIVEAGSWRGNRVAASASSGVVVFRVEGGQIRMEQLLRLGHRFPTGVFEPQLDESGRRVTAWGVLEAQPRQAFASAAVVECVLAERRCVRGPNISSALGPRLVYDPSRP